MKKLFFDYLPYQSIPFPVPKVVIDKPDETISKIIEYLYKGFLEGEKYFEIALKELKQAFNANGAQIALCDIEKEQFLFNYIYAENIGIQDIKNYEIKINEFKGIGVQLRYTGRALATNLHFYKNVEQERINNKIVPPEHARTITITIRQGDYAIWLCATQSIENALFTHEDCSRLGSVAQDLNRMLNIYISQLSEGKDDIKKWQFIKNINDPIAIINGNGNFIFKNSIFEETIGSEYNYIFENSSWALNSKEAILKGKNIFVHGDLTFHLHSINKTNIQGHSYLFDYEKTRLILSIYKDNTIFSNSFKRIANTYGLTKSEVDIIDLLIKGNNVEGISIKRKRSKETIRTQIKSLREKTGAKNLVELLSNFI